MLYYKLQNELSNPSTPLDDFRNIPAVRSVSQFGYDEKLVKEAYDTLKKDRKSGNAMFFVLLQMINKLDKSETYVLDTYWDVSPNGCSLSTPRYYCQCRKFSITERGKLKSRNDILG